MIAAYIGFSAIAIALFYNMGRLIYYTTGDRAKPKYTITQKMAESNQDF